MEETSVPKQTAVSDKGEEESKEEKKDSIWAKKEEKKKFTIDKPDQISGVHMGSQHMFMDHKNDGIGADYAPTRWWWKKSAHVTFRRPLVVNSDKTLDLSTDEPLNIYL